MVQDESTPTAESGDPKAASAEAVPSEAPAPEPPLTDVLVERFALALEKDGKKAYGRWGFALYHSLSDELTQAEILRLGLEARDALDHYNAGCHWASAQKWDRAVESFSQALKLDPMLAEAQFNLALAQEKAGETSSAKKSWNHYLEKCENDDEVAEIKEHLTELANR